MERQQISDRIRPRLHKQKQHTRWTWHISKNITQSGPGIYVKCFQSKFSWSKQGEQSQSYKKHGYSSTCKDSSLDFADKSRCFIRYSSFISTVIDCRKDCNPGIKKQLQKAGSLDRHRLIVVIQQKQFY